MLPVFSKVLEKLLYNRLIDYINNVFLEKFSTSLAPLGIMENITKLLDEDEYTIAVLIDLRKAFDTINC